MNSLRGGRLRLGAVIALIGSFVVQMHVRFTLNLIFVMAVFSIAIGLAVWILCSNAAIPVKPPHRAADHSFTGGTWVTLVAIVGYVGLMSLLGFVVATTIYLTVLFGVFLSIEKVASIRKRWWRELAIALGVTALIYLFFASGLGVPLPSGLL